MLRNFERSLSHMRYWEKSLDALNMTTLGADTKQRRHFKDLARKIKIVVAAQVVNSRQLTTIPHPKDKKSHPIIKGLKARRIISTIEIMKGIKRDQKHQTTTGK